jgi:hypothetical protein
MSLFYIKLTYKIISETALKSYEEQIRIIEASSINLAYYKAMSLGKNEAIENNSIETSKVYWEFFGLTELKELPEIKDGIELETTTQELHPEIDVEKRYFHRMNFVKNKLTTDGVATLTSVFEPCFNYAF